MQPEIAIVLRNIRQKVQQLIADKTALLKKNEQLQTKLDQQAKLQQQQAQQIIQLQQQLQAIQTLQNNLPPDEKKQLEKAIDKHIATIEKTITLLNE
jgi:predicted nuclease with TOPRIM domain